MKAKIHPCWNLDSFSFKNKKQGI